MSDDKIVIDFSVAGNSLNFVRTGWSHPEPDLSWMVGFDSQVIVPRSIAWDQLFLTIDMMPHVRETLRSQRLVIAANNFIIGTFEVKTRGSIEVEIPHNLFANKAGLLLRFLHPDSNSPRALAGIDDDRPLAIAVFRILLSPSKLPVEEHFGDLIKES